MLFEGHKEKLPHHSDEDGKHKLVLATMGHIYLFEPAYPPFCTRDVCKGEKEHK